MTYTEILRVRRALIVYSCVLATFVAIILVAVLSAHANISVEGSHSVVVHGHLRDAIAAEFARHGETIPLTAIFFASACGATIMATIFATTLARERLHNAPLAWTKPVSRERFALEYFAVDAAGILAAFLITFLLCGVLVLWALKLLSFVRADASTWLGLVLCAGMAVAYYGIIRLLTVTFPSRSGAIAGGSWAVAYALIILAAVPLPTSLHVIVLALDFLNPLAYLSQVGAHGQMVGAIDLSVPARIACVWALAIVTSIAAIAVYRRAEA